MLNCRHVTRLVSQSMDAKLPWHHRVAVRIHLLYCVWCRRYAAQIRFLRQAAKEIAGAANLEPKLSVEAKEQMRQRVHEALKTPPSES
jgi:hypothetical protein